MPKPQDTENILVNLNWKDAPHHVVSSWGRVSCAPEVQLQWQCSYFGLTLSFGTLNADSGPFAFVCLFCNMDIKVVERRQFHWV